MNADSYNHYEFIVVVAHSHDVCALLLLLLKFHNKNHCSHFARFVFTQSVELNTILIFRLEPPNAQAHAI